MFSRGGMAVLDAIESIGYDTLNRRPEVSKGKQVRLLGRALVTHVFAGTPTPINEARRITRAAENARPAMPGRAGVLRRVPSPGARGAQQFLSGVFSAAEAEARRHRCAIRVYAFD